MTGKATTLLSLAVLAALVPTVFVSAQQGTPSSAKSTQSTIHRVPKLGADLSFGTTPSPLIDGWLDKKQGDQMADAFRRAGVRSLRFSFAGLYSPSGPEATARLKGENKLTNTFEWFALDKYVDFIESHDFTTIVGINVEEGPALARDAVQKFIDRGLKSRIIAVELSNEPWLNYRPWLPEEYATRAADVIEALTPLGVSFALPLTVGNDNKTPTKLSDTEWVTRMLRKLSTRIDLKGRSDIYGVLHLYSKGMRGTSVDYFNKVVRPFSPNMRYLVTEFNIRLGLEGNPHLTNSYAMEFARKLAEVMSRPEIEAMYTHAVPAHSILYWANGRRYATVVGGRDEKLTGDSMKYGWHLTPTGRVYDLYSRLAWSGELIAYRDAGNQSYWAVGLGDGRTIVTFINDTGREAEKKVKIAGREIKLVAPPRSIVCMDGDREIEHLTLQY